MDVRGFSVPYHGDEQQALKALEKQIAAWRKQYPAVRILDTMVTIGGGCMHATVAYENRYASAQRVTM